MEKKTKNKKHSDITNAITYFTAKNTTPVTRVKNCRFKWLNKPYDIIISHLGVKLYKNSDLIYMVIYININWYEKIIVIKFFHKPSPMCNRVCTCGASQCWDPSRACWGSAKCDGAQRAPIAMPCWLWEPLHRGSGLQVKAALGAPGSASACDCWMATSGRLGSKQTVVLIFKL